MTPAIRICPIKQLYGILAQEEHPHSVAVLSSSFDVRESRVPIPHIVEIFDDVDREIPGRSLSAEAAQRIAHFIKNVGPEIETVYVCCDSGISRSSAIAAAVCRYFGISDSSIWENPKYQPNPLVFHLLGESLGLSISDELLDILIYTNRSAFRNAVKRKAP
jgi:predicted protein tyrosine phosphatase